MASPSPNSRGPAPGSGGNSPFAAPAPAKGGRILINTGGNVGNVTNVQQQQIQVVPGSGSGGSSPIVGGGQFQHPQMSRPVSVQIPRNVVGQPQQMLQQQQQRLGQSPFSPQTPLSPLDQQFPLSPAPQQQQQQQQIGLGGTMVVDSFARPPSENSQQDSFLNVSVFSQQTLLPNLITQHILIFLLSNIVSTNAPFIRPSESRRSNWYTKSQSSLRS